jgi:DNA-binding NarL/FixJ family response regulator
VRVLLADDHTLVRAGIRRLLESFGDIEVVAEARSGRETLELAHLHRPDVAVLDLSMPEGNGLETTARLREQLPGIAVVIMSMHADLAHVREALDRGARGFVVKDGAVAELELALRAAIAGQTFLSPEVSGRMVNSFMRGSPRNELESLSPRQREILLRIGRGESTKEIAAALGISVKTVETHRTRMMETLGCRRAPELLRLAIRHARELQPDDGTPSL